MIKIIMSKITFYEASALTLKDGEVEVVTWRVSEDQVPEKACDHTHYTRLYQCSECGAEVTYPLGTYTHIREAHGVEIPQGIHIPKGRELTLQGRGLWAEGELVGELIIQ